MAKPIIREYISNDLFQSGEYWPLNACVGQNGGPYYYDDYSIGYFEAGKRLCESLVENHSRVDVVIYPLVYTFRHAIELGLKHLCIVLPKLINENISIKYTHSLFDNWNMVKPYLVKLPDGYNDQEPIQYFEKVLNDLIQFDPKGETFRFPKARDGQLFLQEASHINVVVFGDIMLEIYKIFDYWFTAVEVIYDYKTEIDSYYKEQMKEYEEF